MDPGPMDYVPERSKDYIMKKVGTSNKFTSSKKEFWLDKKIKPLTTTPGYIYQPKYHFLSKKLSKKWLWSK